MSDDRKLIHDIKNCLNALKLNSHCLELFQRDEVVECMDALSTAADRMTVLLEALEEKAPAAAEGVRP